MSDYAELPAQLRALERNELMQRFPLAGFVITGAADAIEALIAERDALRTALRRYGEHADGCALWGIYDKRGEGVLPANADLTLCDCGLSALLLSAEKP